MRFAWTVENFLAMLIENTHIRITGKRALKSYAGVDWETYKKLLAEFQLIDDERIESLSNRAGRVRRFGGGGKQSLPKAEDKLLFILHYYKAYPTMDVMATKYNISRAGVWNCVHGLSRQLHGALHKLGVMPMREMPDIEGFKAYLETNKVHGIIIDATERTVERPSKKADNRAHYSGKKKDIRSRTRS